MIKQTTMRLEGISQLYDIPLWTLRKLASQRAFPGIIKRGASIYVIVSTFEKWFLGHEIQSNSQVQKEGE